MQEDKNLKDLLLKGGLEKASPAFTNLVMKRIERIKYINEPLISNKLIRIYRFVFITILGLLFLTGLVIKIYSLPVTINLKLPAIYIQYSDTILIYIIAFWALLFISKKLNSKTKRHQ
jgi:hypothetical protein